MSTPNHPLRMELRFELPGTPEQIWDAIATAGGISSWFLQTDLDEREGGTIVTHMGPGESSEGTVTGWDPPHRLAFEEPDWAALVGQEGADVTPLATEFLVEAQSGGSCVVRVVSSAFGVGADWEDEFFEEMEESWKPFFEHLRLYLEGFAGQRATRLSVAADLQSDLGVVMKAMRDDLGIVETGQTLDQRGISGSVNRLDDMAILLRLTCPAPGYMSLFAFPTGEGQTRAGIEGYFFSGDATGYVEREAPQWRAWLEKLAV